MYDTILQKYLKYLQKKISFFLVLSVHITKLFTYYQNGLLHLYAVGR